MTNRDSQTTTLIETALTQYQAHLLGEVELINANSFQSHENDVDESLRWGKDFLDLLSRVSKPHGPLTSQNTQRSPENSLGRFIIKGHFGEGGFGTVYRAYDPKMNREVALKIPRLGVLLTEEGFERFRREGVLASKLSHPNIVQIYETGKINSFQPYITYSSCNGPNMATWLAESRVSLCPLQAAYVILQLSEAVGHAHNANIYHRDIKPANVLFAPIDNHLSSHSNMGLDFIPKLIDFGLAKEGFESGEFQHTTIGGFLGTMKYMSPEQASGTSNTARPSTDIYALGTLLYELLSGRPPFIGDSDENIRLQILHTPPLSLKTLNPSVPDELSSICHKCLSKLPMDRYDTALSLARALRDFIDRPNAKTSKPSIFQLITRRLFERRT